MNSHKAMQRMSDETSVLFVQGAAYVEFDVHLSKDAVPIIYHDLTCCISTKMVRLSFSFRFPHQPCLKWKPSFWQKNDKTQELIEVPVKDLTFDQLQLLKVKTRSDVKALQSGGESADSCVRQRSDPVWSSAENKKSFQLPKSGAVASNIAISS